MWVISTASQRLGYPNNAPFCWPGYPSAIYKVLYQDVPSTDRWKRGIGSCAQWHPGDRGGYPMPLAAEML